MRLASRLTEMRETRFELFQQLERINDKALEEKRDLHPDEQKKYGKIEARMDFLGEEVERLERENGIKTPQMTRAAVAGPAQTVRPGGDSHRTEREQRDPRLSREDSMLDWANARGADPRFDAQDVEEFSLGRGIRGLITGDWKDAEIEHRALVEGTDASGGFLTPEVLSSKIIDRVRTRARVLEAGAQTLALDSDSVSLPRLTSGVTGAWRAENAPVAEETPAFDRVTFRPKSLATLVKCSYELWEDMIDGGAQLIENEIISGLSLEIDRAALRGSGAANQPTGVRNQAGVTLQSMGANGGTPSYTSVMTAVTTLLGNNITPTGAILASRTYQQLSSLVDTTNQPLNPPAPVQNLPFYPSNQVPVNLTQGTSSDTSEIYVADWTNLVIGVKPWVRVEILGGGSNGLGIGVAKDPYTLMNTEQIQILATARIDVQLLHPEAFAVITGTRP